MVFDPVQLIQAFRIAHVTVMIRHKVADDADDHKQHNEQHGWHLLVIGPPYASHPAHLFSSNLIIGEKHKKNKRVLQYFLQKFVIGNPAKRAVRTRSAGGKSAILVMHGCIKIAEALEMQEFTGFYRERERKNLPQRARKSSRQFRHGNLAKKAGRK